MFYDAFQEHCDYEMNARYDYISEAYAGTGETDEQLRYEQECYEAEAEIEHAAMVAEYGPWVAAVSYDDLPF